MRLTRPRQGNDERRPGPALVVSVILHAGLIVLLLEALAVPAQLRSWLLGPEATTAARERISYVVVAPPPPSGPPTLGRIGGDGRRGNAEASVPIAPPAFVPDRLPDAPTGERPATAEDIGTGPLIGGGGPRRGVQPSYGDPRVWVAPGPIVTDPKTPEQRLDSALISSLERYRDSLAAVRGPAGRRPGDWTIERGGQKFGMDEQFIRLGPISIPNAVLAALPLNVQGNPIAMEREKRLSMMRAEIIEQAQRGMNEQEFRDAVKSIRERKERERQREAAERREREKERPAPEPPPVTR